MQRACTLAQQVVATTRRYRPVRFEEVWVDTGMAHPTGEAGVRIRWKGTMGSSGPGPALQRPQMELFTDGSARRGRAGWGWVGMADDEYQIESDCGPVVGRQTNNVGEVQAITQGLRWAREAAHSVVVRYDSEYAANMTQGKWRAKSNREVILEARQGPRGCACGGSGCDVRTCEGALGP